MRGRGVVKVLVTGANGLLGQKLLSLLQEVRDVELVATTRARIDLPFRASFHELDITDSARVATLIRSIAPNVIIHTAAMTQVDRCEQDRHGCWRVNAEGVRNLALACNSPGCQFIYLSTDFVFSGAHGPLAEDDTPQPVNYYGSTKLAGEEIVRSLLPRWCIIRTALVYGTTVDRSRSNIVLWVKENLEAKRSIRVVTDQWRTPTLAEDLARGCWLAARQHASGVFHISGKDLLSPYQIARKTAAFYALDASLIHPTSSEELHQAARRPLKTGFIIEKARRVLGYEPHTFDEGMIIMAAQVQQPG